MKVIITIPEAKEIICRHLNDKLPGNIVIRQDELSIETGDTTPPVAPQLTNETNEKLVGVLNGWRDGFYTSPTGVKNKIAFIKALREAVPGLGLCAAKLIAEVNT